MKDLIERVRELNEPANESNVQDVIQDLGHRFGENPSIKTLEAVVQHYKDELKQILKKELLEWMQENDQIVFETEDFKVAIKTYVSAKMVNPEIGFIWLQDREYGDLIKDNLEFPKGELTSEVEGALESMGLSYIKKSGIAPASLKKIMSDRLKDGEDLPDEEENGIKIGYYDECVVKEK